MVEIWREGVPTLPAYEIPGGVNWVVFCPVCECWHYHGQSPGHRAAHCVGRAIKVVVDEYGNRRKMEVTIPEMTNGYNLEFKGKLTKEIRDSYRDKRVSGYLHRAWYQLNPKVFGKNR